MSHNAKKKINFLCEELKSDDFPLLVGRKCIRWQVPGCKSRVSSLSSIFLCHANCGLNMVSNYMATTIVLTFSIPDVRKITISQKLLEEMSSNFRIGSFNECGIFGDKMKPVQDQRAWGEPSGFWVIWYGMTHAINCCLCIL